MIKSQIHNLFDKNTEKFTKIFLNLKINGKIYYKVIKKSFPIKKGRY